MSKASIPLDMISVASPCHAEWDDMSGDDKSRFCGQCSKNVYNLSAMTAGEAQNLIEEHEGTMCVRYYKRFRRHNVDCGLPRRLARPTNSA